MCHFHCNNNLSTIGNTWKTWELANVKALFKRVNTYIDLLANKVKFKGITQIKLFLVIIKNQSKFRRIHDRLMNFVNYSIVNCLKYCISKPIILIVILCLFGCSNIYYCRTSTQFKKMLKETPTYPKNSN